MQLKGMWGPRKKVTSNAAGKRFVNELRWIQRPLTSDLVNSTALTEFKNGDIAMVYILISEVCSISKRVSMKLSSNENRITLDGKGVGFLSFASDGELVLIIKDPHDGVTLLENMTHDGTLNVINSDSNRPEGSFSVYSIPYDNTANWETRCDECGIIAKFVLDALYAPIMKTISAMSMCELMWSKHFCQEQRISHRANFISIASTSKDFSDFSTGLVRFARDEWSMSAALIDHKDDNTWSVDPNVVILISGESGIGKTLEMITNFSNETDLTVYIKLERDISLELTNEERNEAFKSFAAERVLAAMKATCLWLNDKLTTYKEAAPFRVRICFDEMGCMPCATRACCAVGPEGIRDALGWSKEPVQVRVFAAGTGVTIANSCDASGSGRVKLGILGASRGRDLYWTFRTKMLETWRWCSHKKWKSTTYEAPTTSEAKCFVRFEAAEKTVGDCWNKPFQKRADAIRVRNNALRTCFELVESNRELVTQALLAAVESDNACTLALENPRVAALIVAQCEKVGLEMEMSGQIARGLSGYYVRREVLQPVAEQFKNLNILWGSETAARILVESFRCAILDGYESEIDSTLKIGGVVVDETNFVLVTEAEQECYAQVNDANGEAIVWRDTEMSDPTPAPDDNPTHIACYRKDVGRYCISPAMVVVLSTLMAGAFDDRFSDMNDVFGHAVAKFLFLATQVFDGRPVSSLVDFIVGPLAIVGPDALRALSGEGAIVSFASLTLRVSGALNARDVAEMCEHDRKRADAAPPQINCGRGGRVQSASRVGDRNRNASGAARPTGEAGVSRKLSVSGDSPLERAEADAWQHAHTQAQLDKLWSARREGEAWIDICPPNLPSADVVLHIPGVITLALQFKDVAQGYAAKNVEDALTLMDGRLSPIAQRNVYAEKLRDLGAPVVPILFSARLDIVLNGRAMKTDMLAAIGEGCIVAEAISGPTLHDSWEKKNFDPLLIGADTKWSCIRLHRIRRNMMLFDYRKDACADAEELASVRVSKWRTPAAATGEYRNGSCMSFSRFVDDALKRQTTPAPEIAEQLPAQQKGMQGRRRSGFTGK